MDNSIRKNEICVIGLPRCDYVFSSTRSCFIAYGFEESPLEMNILKDILGARGIESIEAGGLLSPAQNAFCAKICSKIITSQFWIVLLNNEEQNEYEIPNANVNMEYGLMLGFNKYIIPFQRKSQRLPFNVAGLDTIKYSNSDFKRLAEGAIDQAIEATKQKPTKEFEIDQVLHTFVLSKQATLSDIADQGERAIFQLGSPLGFNLLHDFSGLEYIFLGNFTSLRPETVLWRINLLNEALEKRINSIPERIKLGLIQSEQSKNLENLLKKIQLWVIVNTDEDKEIIITQIQKNPTQFSVTLYSLTEVNLQVERLSS